MLELHSMDGITAAVILDTYRYLGTVSQRASCTRFVTVQGEPHDLPRIALSLPGGRAELYGELKARGLIPAG